MLLLAAAPAVFGQLPGQGGPPVISRGGGGGVTPAAPISLRPYVNVSGLFTSGLMVARVDSDGRLASESAAGVEGALGLYGYHGWKNTVLGVNYRGDYRRYDRKTIYNRANQFLSFGVAHQFNPRLAVSVRQGAGSFNQHHGYLGTFGFFDPTFAQVPQDEILDTRTDYFTTMADVTLMKSPRLSFNFGGTGFTVRRRLSALYGVTGASARGDAVYRLSRRTTIGADYFFSHFGFNQAFGSADLHSAGINYSVQLSRWWALAFRIGAVRMETLSLGVVRLDPVVAAIIGQSQGYRAFHRIQTGPAYSAQVSRRFRHATAMISGQYGASPGNGVYLASRHNVVSGHYSHTGMRHWSMAFSAGYSDMRSVGQQIGRYESVHAGTSVTRALGSRNFFVTARCDVRYVTTGQAFSRTYSTASIGVAYSPGDVPLRLW